jgi:hypothetical protein
MNRSGVEGRSGFVLPVIVGAGWRRGKGGWGVGGMMGCVGTGRRRRVLGRRMARGKINAGWRWF